MNKYEIKEILLRFDECGCYERPSGFDFKQMSDNVVKLSDALQKSFGLKFQIDSQVQDASFFCDIRIPHELVVKPRIDLSYTIRISNFGRLAKINFSDEYSVETRRLLQQVIVGRQFEVIESEVLDEIYDGQFEAFKNILGGELPTWYHRYFDYL